MVTGTLYKAAQNVPSCTKCLSPILLFPILPGITFKKQLCADTQDIHNCQMIFKVTL